VVASPGVANAAAAAERSGTAVVRITHDHRAWAGTTIRWHDQDLAVSQDAPRRPGRAGSELLVVDGTMYGIDPDGRWVVLGDPGTGASAWRYTVTYSGLGATSAPVAPADARPLRERLRAGGGR
jgi:hypothetical protein